jgi:tetratricopeptide (TPR) repeat protein
MFRDPRRTLTYRAGVGDLISDDLARRVEAAARAGGVVADLDQVEMAAQTLLALELAERFVGHSEEFELFAAERDYEFDDWLVNLPNGLARAGLLDEAVRAADALAALQSGFESDFACGAATILARAGRTEEARARIEVNVGRFAENPWAWLEAGEALALVGDIDAAAAAYERAVDAAEQRDDATEVSDVYGHASDFFARHPHVPTTLREPRTRVRVSRGPDKSVVVRTTTTLTGSMTKVPRNATCPCGSGRKFKRCCGGAG